MKRTTLRCFVVVFTLFLLARDGAPQNGTWVSIGPAPIRVPGLPEGMSPWSGRVAYVAVDPSDSDHWLIGAPQGGIWETKDAGVTWAPRTDSLPDTLTPPAIGSLAMGAIAFAPGQPNVVYAGTGDAVFNQDAYDAAGVLKSTDGGTTWSLVATEPFARATFSDLKLHPHNPYLLLAATTAGWLRLSTGRGVFKSTHGGIKWQQKLKGNATDLEMHPGDFEKVYAAIGRREGSEAGMNPNGVYRSTDGGDTWTLIAGPWSTMEGGIGRAEMAISPSDPNILYVSIQDAVDGVGDDGGLLGLFRTDNAWDSAPSWVNIDTSATGEHGYCEAEQESNPNPFGRCWVVHDIIVDPAIPDTLYAGGISLWRCDQCTGAAPIWTDIGSEKIHVDMHHLAWAGNRLIVGNDGGIWSTTDGGNSYANHNTNLSITQFNAGSLHPTDPYVALGGSKDNGIEKWEGDNEWRFVRGGDGGPSAFSSSFPDTHWVMSAQQLRIFRTRTGGATSFRVDSGIDKDGATFIAPLEMCPHNDDVITTASNNVWRSDDFFSGAPSNPTWVPNSPEHSIPISALAFAPTDSDCMTYAFGTSGFIRLTINGGNSWRVLDPSDIDAIPNRTVSSLAFDPTDANILYVTLRGFDEGTPGQPGHVFKTTNALCRFEDPPCDAPTWTNVSPPVNVQVRSIVVDPADPNTLYVGTDLGVWQSADAGESWVHMVPENGFTGLPNVWVFDLKINRTTNKLVAFTFGRGAFVLDLP